MITDKKAECHEPLEPQLVAQKYYISCFTLDAIFFGHEDVFLSPLPP